MKLDIKDEWARILAGNYVKKICEDNNLTSDEDVDEYISSSDSIYDDYRSVLEIYLHEMNSKD